MESDSGFQEKMNVLDLIISVLREHEKKLDEISHQLEDAVSELKAKEAEKGALVKEQVTKASISRRIPLVTLNRWDDFRARFQGADVAAFRVEMNTFEVYAVSDDQLFRYSESLPKNRIMVSEGEGRYSIDKAYLRSVDDLTFLINGRLSCGLDVSVEVTKTALPERKSMLELDYNFDSEKVKGFLSKELNVPVDKIVEGRLSF